MDCRTARLLLEYARPGSAELDAAESRALEEHLSACETCDQMGRAERRADEAVGKAMRQVEVPDRLRVRILERLKQERGDTRRRRWVSYGLRAGMAAAALLLLTLGLWRWVAPRPAFPAERMLTEVRDRVYAPPTLGQVKATFASQGVETTPPPGLNYSYLRWMFLTDVEGRRTPTLFFNNAHGDGGAGRPQHALVFIVSDRQFDANALPPNPTTTTDYEYKCVIRHAKDDPYGYVIYYTGADLAWLDGPTEPPDAANGN